MAEEKEYIVYAQLIVRAPNPKDAASAATSALNQIHYHPAGRGTVTSAFTSGRVVRF